SCVVPLGCVPPFLITDASARKTTELFVPVLLIEDTSLKYLAYIAVPLLEIVELRTKALPALTYTPASPSWLSIFKYSIVTDTQFPTCAPALPIPRHLNPLI